MLRVERSRRSVALFIGLATIGQAVSVPAMVRTTIQIDGVFSDWQAALTDPGNVVQDRRASDGDPDSPSNPARDLLQFAVTWDASALYLYWRRQSGTGSPADMVVAAYIDTGHDWQLGLGDRILLARQRGDRIEWSALYGYVPSGGSASPDPLGGDGETPAGAGLWFPAEAAPVAMSGQKVEFEARIPWSALGIPAGSPLLVHGSLAKGDKLRDPDDAENDDSDGLRRNVVDNAALLDTQFYALALTADRQVSASSPGSVDLAHRVLALGNGTQEIELAVVFAGGGIEIRTDPDGDGDPGDGVLLAIDANGDGDFFDPGDILAPGADTTGDGLPDSGPIATGAAFPFVVTALVPAGLGAVDLVALVSAHSSRQPARSEVNRDTVAVGELTLLADRSVLVRPGDSVSLRHTVCSHLGAAEDVDVAAGSSRGWPTAVRVGGVPVTRVALAPGGCAELTVVSAVPASEPIGTVASVLTVVSLASRPSVSDANLDRAEVHSGLAIEPAGSGIAVAGTSAFYPHRLVNAAPVAATFALSAVSSAASGVTFWWDPNGDGDISDGLTIAVTPPLAASGGVMHLIAQVDIPAVTAIGTVEVTTVTATDRADPARRATVDDTTTVRAVATYASPPPAVQVSTFPGCATLWVLGGRVDDVAAWHRFSLIDPGGLPIAFTTTALPDEDGVLDGSFTFALDDPAGQWRLQLERRDGAIWVPVTPGGSHEVSVVDDLTADGGLISLILTDRTEYPLSGETMAISTVLDNQTPFLLESSTVEYALFRDQDGDGQPSAGEPYIDSRGRHAAWNVSLPATCRATGIAAVAAKSNYLERRCDAIGPIEFEEPGEWTMLAEWITECGDIIASRRVKVNAGCVSTAMADAGRDPFICRGDAAPLGTPADPRWHYAWSPDTYLDDPSSPQPVASPPTTVTYTLSVTDESGCVRSDTVVVLVIDPPPADAGPSATTCPGEPVQLGTPPPADTFLSYRWEPATGLDDPSAAQPMARPSVSTTYRLTVTAEEGECAATDFVDVALLPAVTADPGSDQVAPAVIGPAACDPALSYSWSPAAGLDDPAGCRPVASPAVLTEYCLTVLAPSGCDSIPTCVRVGTEACTAPPGEVRNLRLTRWGGDLGLNWDPDAMADAGYNGYAVASKAGLDAPRTAASRLFTTPDRWSTTARHAGAGEIVGPGGEIGFYRVAAVCNNGVTEGP